MAQTASAPAAAADPMSYAVVSPEASLVARELLKMALANSAAVSPAWEARLQALLANVLMNDVLNWWNDAGPAELNEANAAADEAIRLTPNSALAHQAQGLVQSGRGLHNDARKTFRRAKGIDRGFARGHAQFGNQKSFLGRLDEVQDPLDKAISLINQYHPTRGYFYWGKGRGFFLLKDWPNAIDWLQRSVAALPSVWYNRCYLAAAQDAANDATAAGRTMQDFLNDQRFGRPVLARAVAALANPTGVPSLDAARQTVHNFLSQI